jgi:4-hydroxy-tetrahydrodipicolinate reductase
MGHCVLELAACDDRFDVVAAITKSGCPMVGKRLSVGSKDLLITTTLEDECDVLIDFSIAEATSQWLEICKGRAVPMVIGSTGHTDAQLTEIKLAASECPILKASNFSVGIQAVLGLLGRVKAELGDAYDVEIVESHHRHKVDAPSGTALAMLDELGVGATVPIEVVFGRAGNVGPRPAGQIGVHSVRLGEVVGQHEIHFSGPGETVTIRHTAHSREAFAAGALRAAQWIVGRPAGLFSMADVLHHSGA